MKYLRVALVVESVGLLVLATAFFRLQTVPELAITHVPMVAATIEPETHAPAPATIIPAEPQPWTMLAVGDIMLDRYVRTTMKTKGMDYPFAAIKPTLAGHDVVVGNLEGPFTSHPSVATETHLIFTFDPAVAPILATVGFTDVSLANNHTLNFGQSGLDQTRQVLTSAGIKYFGDPRNKNWFGYIQEVAGRTIAFVGYVGLTKGLDGILSEIKDLRQRADVVIVMAHWGNEYQLNFNNRQQSDAHAMIDAGADLVLGAHPHVVQPFEVYKDKFIAYSLGNFLFDQYFSSDTLEGLMLQLNFSPSQLSIDLIPTVTERGQIHLLTGSRHDSLLSRLAADSVIPDTLRPDIRLGHFILSNQ